MKKFAIEEPIYKSALNCYVDCSYDEMIDFVEKKIPNIEFPDGFNKGENDEAIGTLLDLTDPRKKGSKLRILWINKNEWFIADYGSIMHECIHAAQFVLDDKGLNTSHLNTEAVAYLAEYYFTQFLAALKPKKHESTRNKPHKKKTNTRVR